MGNEFSLIELFKYLYLNMGQVEAIFLQVPHSKLKEKFEKHLCTTASQSTDTSKWEVLVIIKFKFLFLH